MHPIDNLITPLKEFKPTYLYIKQHSVTGLLYFGKTERSHDHMLKYTGSGNRWLPHIKKHGKQFVETIWYCLFCDQEECTTFATLFSEQQKIVESDTWANYIVENGITGGKPKGCRAPNKGKKQAKPAWNKGIKMTPEQCKNMQGPNNNPRQKWTEEQKIAQSILLIGKPKRIKRGPATVSHCKNISEGKTGKFHKRVVCPQCGKEGAANGMTRYHFNNCKVHPNE